MSLLFVEAWIDWLDHQYFQVSQVVTVVTNFTQGVSTRYVWGAVAWWLPQGPVCPGSQPTLVACLAALEAVGSKDFSDSYTSMKTWTSYPERWKYPHVASWGQNVSWPVVWQYRDGVPPTSVNGPHRTILGDLWLKVGAVRVTEWRICKTHW